MRDHEAIGRVVAMQDDAYADAGDRAPKEPRASARAVIVRKEPRASARAAIVRRRRPTHAVRCSPPTRRAVPRRQATAEFHQETAPAEHAVYDAYGQATLYAWPSADVNGSCFPYGSWPGKARSGRGQPWLRWMMIAMISAPPTWTVLVMCMICARGFCRNWAFSSLLM
mgnify:CR=1 FL=1